MLTIILADHHIYQMSKGAQGRPVRLCSRGCCTLLQKGPRRAPWVVSAADVTAADKGSADSGGGGQRERVATASNQEPGAEVVMGVMGV